MLELLNQLDGFGSDENIKVPLIVCFSLQYPDWYKASKQ